MTYEHRKISLADEDTATLLHRAAVRLAQAAVPPAVAQAFMLACMTALLKPDGNVRGIATSTAFRRLVARCLACKHGPEMEAACRPYQYALSTRAGTECVAHMFRAATDADARATALSVDGIGAYDHVLRSAMLGKLARLPKASEILPFVRLSYAQPSEYVWEDDEGTTHRVPQGEGGEQGDPLMPLLFALAIHDALADVAELLRPGEDVCAFLDDVYVLCKPERTREIFDMLRHALRNTAGIDFHLGKTRVWNRAGEVPSGIADLGPDVWAPDGLVILGSPVGKEDFIAAEAAKRLANECELWDALKVVPNLQCAWQILARCAVPRMSHTLRTLPPNLSVTYAALRDTGLWDTGLDLLSAAKLTPQERAEAWRIASLPARLGGLGLRAAERTARAAY